MVTHAQPTPDRLAQALIIGASLLLAAALAAVALLAAAIHQRALEPPRFVVHVGQMYLSAPCPSPTFDCDVNLNYYAIWRGQAMPDGRIHYDEMYFTYLPKKGR